MQGLRAHKTTLAVAIIGLSMTTLDQTVVFVAIAAIERALDLGLSGQQWVVNSYLTALSSLLLFGGALADRHGPRRMYLVGLGVFTAGSLGAALAFAPWMLLSMRIVQGIGAAWLMPTTLALLTSRFRGADRPAAIGLWASFGGIISAIAPLVGGVLVDTLSWRWIFLLNLPLAAIAAWLAFAKLEEVDPEQRRPEPLDWGGAMLIVAGLASLTFFVTEGTHLGWTHPAVLGAGGAALVLLPWTLVHESRQSSALLPLHLFRSRPFAAANAATLMLYGAFHGSFFILMLYLQGAMGYSALQAGSAVLPMTLIFVGLSIPLGRYSQRIGPRWPMALGALLFAGGLWYLAFLSVDERYWIGVLPGVALLGIALAIAVPPLTNTAMSAVPERHTGIASGVNNSAARLAAVLAVATLGGVYSSSFRSSFDPAVQSPELVQRLQRSPTSFDRLQALPRKLREPVTSASTAAYRHALWSAGGAALLAALLSLVFLRSSDLADQRDDDD